MDIQVGNIIYFERFGKLIQAQKVERITPTGIIKTSGYNLRNEGDYLRITGQDKWQTTFGRLETPELKQQWREQHATEWLNRNYSRIKPEDIEPLMDKYKD